MSGYRFIEVEKVNHAVWTRAPRLQNRLLPLVDHLLSAPARVNLVLRERIAAIHARSRQT